MWSDIHISAMLEKRRRGCRSNVTYLDDCGTASLVAALTANLVAIANSFLDSFKHHDNNSYVLKRRLSMVKIDEE